MPRKIFTLLIASLIFCAAVARLFLGVDFTDESHYLAMALKFLRGQTPFVDELVFHQTSALLVTPFLRPFYERFGTEGIVLYGRGLFFALNLTCAIAVFFVFQSRFGKRIAFFSSLAVLAFIPLHIPAISYNTIASAFFMLGLLGYLGNLPLASGFCFAICLVAYPQFLLAILLSTILFKWWHRYPVVPLLLKLAFGAIPLIFLVRLWTLKGASGLPDSIIYMLTAFPFGGGLRKVGAVLWHTLFANPSTAFHWLFAVGCVFLLFARALPSVAKLYFSLLPGLIYWAFGHYFFSATWFFLYFSFTAPLYWWFLPPHEKRSEIFWVLWLPSILAGGVAAYSSSSSAANAIVGLLPAMIVTTIFWTEYVGPRFLIPLMPALLLMFGQFYGVSIYRDGHVTALTERVSSGPYAGLMTTRKKIAYLEGIQDVVAKWQNRRGRILFYEFPAGYLMTEMPSAGRTSWMRTVSQQKEFYLDYYRRGLTPENLVLVPKRIESGISLEIPYAQEDVFLKYLFQTHERVFENRDITLWRPKLLANSLAEQGMDSRARF